MAPPHRHRSVAEGGCTVKENCQMLCRDCNRRKGAE
ncbi:HNH endonuclease [Prevotella sp. KH2C16]